MKINLTSETVIYCKHVATISSGALNCWSKNRFGLVYYSKRVVYCGVIFSLSLVHLCLAFCI